MFDSHLDDLIEKRVTNDHQNVSGLNSRSGLIKPPISRGLKDLIIHSPSSSSSPSSTSSTSSPLSTANIYNHSIANSGTSSISGTPLPLKINSATTTTPNANSSSIKFENRKDQSLREVLDDWRTDFYPNLSYDHFYEGVLKKLATTTTTTSSNNSNINNNNNNNCSDDEEYKDENDDINSVNNNNNGDNEDDHDSYNDTKNTKNNVYNEYLNNLNDHKSNINNNQQESLLEQRVKQWKNDTLLDIQQSSETFMNQLPHRVFEKSSLSNDDELPMTPSTKNEPSDGGQQQSSTASKSKFDMWRENFNISMDEKMKEKKRTNKIIITSKKINNQTPA